jgi:hypothetical protein
MTRSGARCVPSYVFAAKIDSPDRRHAHVLSTRQAFVVNLAAPRPVVVVNKTVGSPAQDAEIHLRDVTMAEPP